MAIKQIYIPDIGDFSDVPIIEVYVKVGATVQENDSILALESEKAVTDIPSPYTGTIKALHLKEGDSVSKGTLVADIEVAEQTAEQPKEAPVAKEPEAPKEEKPIVAEKPVVQQKQEEPAPVPKAAGVSSHATPSVRLYARELEVDLSVITPTGKNGRILKEDLVAYVKGALKSKAGAKPAPVIQLEDFSKYGAIERVTLSRIQKISGPHLQRSYQTIPHVTQADQADVTDLELFRKMTKEELKKKGSTLSLSILPFVIKATVAALKAFPSFNASLDEANSEIIQKHYYHIGVAVDTPEGLVVPVIRDVDQKGILQIAEELAELSVKARERKLKTEHITGASFSISSLGGIGGTFFTPIINAPETAILGLSKMSTQPVWNGTEFVPRTILPFSVSYDHRVIDGAQGARFTTYLASVLSDMKRVLL